MKSLIAAAALTLAAPSAAEVTASAPASFVIETMVTIAALPAKVWATLATPSRWWNPSHTYSGKSDRLSLGARAGGCFCETLDGGGGVEHGRVLFVQPERLLRLTGGLGPLQGEAVTATLSFSLAPQAGGATRLTMTYVVGGYMRQGGTALASPVDSVLTEQLARLKAAAEGVAPATTK